MRRNLPSEEKNGPSLEDDGVSLPPSPFPRKISKVRQRDWQLKRSAFQGHQFIPRKHIIRFSALALTFVVGVHLFLLHNFFMSHHDDLRDLSTPLPLQRQLTKLGEIDQTQYTIRINTWQRLEQLQVSINHHSTCPGVAAIQIVWCNAQGEPPQFLYENDLVHVERHDINTLNERFHIIDQPPTLGILSMDDDVLRPCEAIDAGFFKWVQNPERMVGFDARSHVVDEQTGVWSYAYVSTTERTNRYSLALPRYAFLHRDYLDRYMTELPRPIFQMVAKHFNCEDIAMSFYVSSLTDGKPPLLADYWAMKSMVKLYSAKKISGSSDHKAIRDKCVETFAKQLGLKETLHTAKLVHTKHVLFQCGAEDGKEVDDLQFSTERHIALLAKIQGWKKTSAQVLLKDVEQAKTNISQEAFAMGLLEHTKPWTERWKKDR